MMNGTFHAQGYNYREQSYPLNPHALNWSPSICVNQGMYDATVPASVCPPCRQLGVGLGWMPPHPLCMCGVAGEMSYNQHPPLMWEADANARQNYYPPACPSWWMDQKALMDRNFVPGGAPPTIPTVCAPHNPLYRTRHRNTRVQGQSHGRLPDLSEYSADAPNNLLCPHPSCYDPCSVVPEFRNHLGQFRSSANSSCLLCGRSGHRYTACELFDGKTVCFVDISSTCIYAMRHEHWIERATLGDVCLFFAASLGYVPDGLRLYIGYREVITAHHDPSTRCCDLQLLPGTDVGFIVLPEAPALTAPQVPSTGVGRYGTGGCNGGEVRVVEPLEVSTITKASQISVSTHTTEKECLSERDGGSITIAAAVAVHDRATTEVSEGEDYEAVDRVGAADDGNLTDSPVDSHSPSNHDVGVRSSVLEACRMPVCAQTVEMESEKGLCGNLSCETGGESPLEGDKSLPLPDDARINSSEMSSNQRTVHLKFIPVFMSFAEIRAMLWSCGEVNKVRLVKPKTTPKPDQMFYICFVEYTTEDGAKRMMQMHGRRLVDQFRLAVEFSKQPIRGGYVTDCDAATGKPCTFGLCYTERKLMEKRYNPAGAVDEDKKEQKKKKKNHKQDNKRKQGASKRSEAHTVCSPKGCVKEQSLSTEDPAEDVPYRLQVVARESQSVKKRCSCRGEYEGDVHSASVRATKKNSMTPPRTRTHVLPTEDTPMTATVPAVKLPLFSHLSSLPSGEEKQLLDHLLTATTKYGQNPTRRNFYDALTMLEDIKWNPLSSSVAIDLMKLELALFLHHDPLNGVAGALEITKRATNVASELLHLVVTATAPLDRAQIDKWRSLLSAIPPLRPEKEKKKVSQHATKSKAVQGDLWLPRGRSLICVTPCVPSLMAFISSLIHIVLLLEDLYDEKVSDAQWQLVQCVRSLLKELQLHCSKKKTPKKVSTARKGDAGEVASTIGWHERIGQTLKALPSRPGWSAGLVLNTFLPYVRHLPASTLAGHVEVSLM